MFKIEKYGDLDYIKTRPKDYEVTQKYPAIIFFHGAGTRGNDIEKLKNNLFYEYSINYTDKCITFAPLCNADTWFDIFEQVLGFCEFVSRCSDVDKDRIYLVGASMGAYAIWQIAMSRPELFAGIIPICGGGMYWNSLRLKNIPVWAFHGEEDDCVFAEESIKMVNHINANGGSAKLTLYKNTGHDAWTATYKNKAVFDWLFSNVKNNEEAAYTDFDDSNIYG